MSKSNKQQKTKQNYLDEETHNKARTMLHMGALPSTVAKELCISLRDLVNEFKRRPS